MRQYRSKTYAVSRDMVCTTLNRIVIYDQLNPSRAHDDSQNDAERLLTASCFVTVRKPAC
jgi:hypothetical protein